MANKKQTSRSVASKASSILRDGRYSNKAKSVAGSALAQTKTSGKKSDIPTSWWMGVSGRPLAPVFFCRFFSL